MLLKLLHFGYKPGILVAEMHANEPIAQFENMVLHGGHQASEEFVVVGLDIAGGEARVY